MTQASTAPSLPTLEQALDLMNSHDLKRLFTAVPNVRPPKTKGEMIRAIMDALAGDRLKALWETLDSTQQAAVAETVYAPDGLYRANRFKDKYGQTPAFSVQAEDGRRSDDTLTPLRLLIYWDSRGGPAYVPADLAQRLRAFVPLPVAGALRSLEELPEHYERTDRRYQWQEGDQGLKVIMRGGVLMAPTRPPNVTETVVRVPLERRDTERAALAEAVVLLRLIDQGKVAVSEKTALPGSATLREIGAVLVGGDFYAEKEEADRHWQAIGPIKAFAWPLLVQAGGLAELHGKKLALTKAGRDLLGKGAVAIVRRLWERWLKTRLFDEFNRIDAIKGQQGKGKRGMTAPTDRRAAIDGALRECPPGRWVALAEFVRFMNAEGWDFAITRQPWELYTGDPNYGHLDGYSGTRQYLEQRYLACLLLEYAATLGLIDVAYVPPAEVQADFRDLYGTDDLAFLSRYDGLLYFRVNALGAHCLGHADDYRPSAPEVRATLVMLPDLSIRAEGELTADEVLALDTWAQRDAAGAWRLERERLLAAVERGLRLADLREFLEARAPQGLPPTLLEFLETTGRRAEALKNTGPVLLIECADAATTEQIARHEKTRGLCRQAGPRWLLVRVEAEERFRKAVRVLGFGMVSG